MKFVLRRLVIGCPHYLELTDDEFREIIDATRNVLEAKNIEEKYNIVIDNYVEFESDLLNMALEQMAFTNFGWRPENNDIFKLNRRLANLLTTTRLYMDQVPHNLNSIYGKGVGHVAKVKAAMSAEYDSNLGYRVLEALRNYIQHQGLPIFSVTYDRHMCRKLRGNQILNNVIPYIEVSELRNAGDFKKSVLKELEALGDKVDIRPFVRVYIESIGKIQKAIRDLIEQDIGRWRNVILSTEERYRGTGDKELIGLGLIVQNDVGESLQQLHVNQSVLQRRDWLISKNGAFIRFSNNVITNEVE